LTHLIITGPTASGKTALALKKAKEIGAYIINADALQLYKDLPTLTARPVDIEGVPPQQVLRLFGILEPYEDMNAMKWFDQVQGVIREYGKPYILVGGTGFYIKTFLKGGLSDIPDVPKEIEAYVRGLDKETLLQEIMQQDPAILEVLHKNDTQRLMRALAVKMATGESIRAFQNDDGVKKTQGDVIVIQIDKEVLNQRIRLRTEMMLKNGAIDEVADLLKRYPTLLTLPITKVIGVKEIVSYIKGQMSYDEMMLRIQTLTIQYAKRQRTFMKQFSRYEA